MRLLGLSPWGVGSGYRRPGRIAGAALPADVDTACGKDTEGETGTTGPAFPVPVHRWRAAQGGAIGLPTLQPGAVRWLVILAVAVRVAAAAVLVAGPWTDEATELAGWDVARFQQMADEPGRPYADHEVEYPPGSVVLIETLAGGGVVRTHRSLVALSLAVDLGVAALVRRLGGNRAAGTYLLLGLPLVPMGLLRFDLWAALAAVGAVSVAVAGHGTRPEAGSPTSEARSGPARSETWPVTPAVAGPVRTDLAVGLLVAIGALVKVWPALLVAALWAVGRGRAAAASLAAMAAAGLAWLAWAGAGLDPVGQVLSLRGATGWHLESIPGSLVALFGSSQPELQLDAFRIGHMDSRLVLAGRVVTLAVVAALALGVRRNGAGRPAGVVAGSARSGPDVGLVMLGATAALIVTAPLLSPQFLLWLTPWAALQTAGHATAAPDDRGASRPLVALTAVATTVTGVTLLVFGPPDVGRSVPALLLLGRDGALLAVVALTVRAALRPTGTPAGAGQPRPTPSSSAA